MSEGQRQVREGKAVWSREQSPAATVAQSWKRAKCSPMDNWINACMLFNTGPGSVRGEEATCAFVFRTWSAVGVEADWRLLCGSPTDAGALEVLCFACWHLTPLLHTATQCFCPYSAWDPSATLAPSIRAFPSPGLGDWFRNGFMAQRDQ